MPTYNATSPRRILLVVSLTFIAKIILATHIIGGEMSYKCLGNNDFEVSLKVYRDCINGVPYFDNPASIGVFDNANLLVDDLRPTVISDDTIGFNINNPCLTVPSNICVHVANYRDTINLTPVAGGYTFVYQRCCRNETISNIELPDSLGATYYLHISEEAILNCNNSPVFNTNPPNAVCVNSPLSYNHEAEDEENDAITYRFCTPINGAPNWWGSYSCTPQPCGTRPQPPFNPPYDSVMLLAPYSLENLTNWPLNSPPISIDTQTGLLSGFPNSIGQFAIGVCIEEYRNGVLYSSSNRDFQYNIVNCSSNGFSINFIAQYDTIQPGLVSFFNNTSGSSSDPIVSSEWDFGDGDTSTMTNPTHTYSTNANYLVSLTSTTQSGCSFTQSKYIQYLVPPWPDFSYTVSNNLYSFQNNSLYSSSFLWDFGDGTTSTETNPVHEFIGKQLDYEVKLIAENGIGSDTTSILIQTPTTVIDREVPEFHIYPNPIKSDVCHIDFKGMTVTEINLFSIEGRKLLTQTVAGEKTISLDLSSIPSGIYFLQSVGTSFSTTQKVIIF